MPRISRSDEFTSTDLVVGLNGSNQDYRVYSAETFATWVNTIVTDYQLLTQKVTPADGATISASATTNNIWLLIKPPAAVATLAIDLPSVNIAIDRQEVTVTTTAQIAALTVNGNGASAVHGVPASMGAENSFTLRYDLIDTAWYRI